MKLLNEIIDLLMADDGSLGTALLKTKVLLYRIGQSELVEWVDAELTGYAVRESVPEYRKVYGKLIGTITNGYHFHYRQHIALAHLSEEHRNSLENNIEMRSISVIESSVIGVEKGSTYSIPIEPELCVALSSVYENGYAIQQASTVFQVGQFQQILIEVRSRLLTFILKLQDEIGDSVSDNDAKAAAANTDVPSMFNGAVIRNATFQINGNHNQQTVHNVTVKGDRNALHDKLRDIKVPETDISDLDAAIAEDRDFAVVESDYGPKVKKWIGGMINKAASGVWEVKLGVATGVLTNALSAYYGIAS